MTNGLRLPKSSAYLENGGTIENPQAIAAHESPRMTTLYDRTCHYLRRARESRGQRR
jgi:hypothetical protein